MKIHSLLSATVLSGIALSTASAKDLTLSAVPAPVQETIRSQAGSGKIDDIKKVNAGGSEHYVAEIDLPGEHDLKVHVSTTGALLKVRQEIPLTEAPAAVREAAGKLVPQGGRVDDIHKATSEGKVTYEVEIDRPGVADLKLVFSTNGEVLQQREESHR